jgi:hypothetical protein
MRCLSCKYDLSHLATRGVRRCPECGQKFNPHDFTGVDLGTMKPWMAVMIGLIIAILFTLIMLIPLIPVFIHR